MPAAGKGIQLMEAEISLGIADRQGQVFDGLAHEILLSGTRITDQNAEVDQEY